jgi:hypothetical protein
MKNPKPSVRLAIAFEKTDTTGARAIQLTQFADGSVYLDGAEELIFEGGENSLKDAVDYLEQKGYKKKI